MRSTYTQFGMRIVTGELRWHYKPEIMFTCVSKKGFRIARWVHVLEPTNRISVHHWVRLKDGSQPLLFTLQLGVHSHIKPLLSRGLPLLARADDFAECYLSGGALGCDVLRDAPNSVRRSSPSSGARSGLAAAEGKLTSE